MIKSIFTLILLFLTSSLFSQDVTASGNERAYYECSDAKPIDSNVVKIQSGTLYFDFCPEKQPKKVKGEEYNWMKNYPNGYFTSYLVNASDSIFSATRQDGSLMMIQEALNENGEWQPIEYWVHSGCGNSYMNPLSLSSGEYAFVPIKKYSGDFKTKIRLKFKYGRNVIYSESFDGSIDKLQFNKESDPVNGVLYSGPANYFMEN